MKPYAGLLCALIAGCHQTHPLKGIKDIRPGTTSLQEALLILEDPNRVINNATQPGTQIFHWEEFSLQIEHKIVQAIFRNPTANETSFLYWRHAYRQTPTQLKKIKDTSHWQLTVPQAGLAVIYDEEIDQVTKVVRYEAP